MLEKIHLDKELDEKTYKKRLPGMQRRLFDLEKACWDNRVASIVVFEGWPACGKGGAISTVTQRLDPRGFKLHYIVEPRTYERNRPWLWRYWVRAPQYGEMAIFDGSWYGRVLGERVERLIAEPEWRHAYRDISEFERMMADDGVAFMKFWLHISKKEQKRRLRQLEADPFERWRVSEKDWRAHKKYDKYLIAIEEALQLTDSEYAPWTIVEATCPFFAGNKILEVMIRALEHRLGPLAPPLEEPSEAAASDAEEADLRQAMSDAEVLVHQEV